jgi:alpha-galactosidase
MEFGLWFEPEMVNPDSDLYRQHPEWALGTNTDQPVLGRHQLVLDMSMQDVRDYLFEHIDLLLTTHDISYIKWDHNRPLVGGRSAAQTAGTYELLGRLTKAHPHVQFESCASGGGRIDFGIAQYVQRFWASDSIDALDRLHIQRGLSTFMPLEVLGSHIGSPTCHMTGRKHALSFRAATAMFSWMGVEWNLLTVSDEERSKLARVINVYKQFRPLLHTGDVFRADHDDPTINIHGVLAANRTEALISISRMTSSPRYHSAPLVISDLNANSMYSVKIVPLGTPRWGLHRELPAWVTHGAVISGQHLGTMGIALPPLLPESSVILHLETVPQ